MNGVGRQCVILAGGLGTRLGALVELVPKPMLPVGGRPFLEHLVRAAHRFGFEDFVLLAGYRGQAIAEHFRTDGALAQELGARFRIVVESAPLGTGGALRGAAPFLDPSFLMLNGDSWFDINLLDLASRGAAERATAYLALREVANTGRYGVVERDGERIRGFHERPETGGQGLINGGVYWLDRTILQDIPPGASSIERDIFPKLARERRIFGAAYSGYFIDIGIPHDYERAQQEVAAALRRPAVFFDRDDVLNEDAGYTHRPDQFRWIEGAQAAIKACNDADYLVFVVTNQAGVARGFYDEEAVRALHRWMDAELRASGAHVDAFRYCPHHPKGSVPGYAVECACRKPKPGMIRDLLQSWPVIEEESVLVGDKESDLESAAAAGIRALHFRGGDLGSFLRGNLPRIRA